jgi:ribonuclease D
MKGLSPRYIRQWGDDLLDAIEHGRKNQLSRPPRRERPDPVMADRFTILQNWRKQIAEKRGLDSVLIISRQTLWDIAHKLPRDKEALAQIEGIGQWRLENYGDSLLKVISTLR